MKALRRALPVLLLASLSGLSMMTHAHDSSAASSHSKQYNPWRPVPRQWGNQHKQQRTVTVQRVTTPVYVVPMHPIHARQYEYRNYVQQVNPYYGNGGIPWWSDPVAVPYGPWSQNNGLLNGLW